MKLSNTSTQNGNSDITFVAMAHNVEKVKYPWRQSILSILPVAERVVIVIGNPNDDDTPDTMQEFFDNNKKVVVVEKDWPSIHTGLSGLVNFGTEYADTKWVAQIQLDEIFSEDDYDELRGLASLPDRVQAASFGFRHFCGDFSHVFPFVYERVVRAFRTDSDFLFVGDAVQAEGHGEVYSANVTVNHAGKVHVGRQKEASFKEYDFQDKLYRGKEMGNPVFARGDIDPRIEQAYAEGHLEFDKIFKEAYERGEVKDYNGPYCKYLREWAHELGVELP